MDSRSTAADRCSGRTRWASKASTRRSCATATPLAPNTGSPPRSWSASRRMDGASTLARKALAARSESVRHLAGVSRGLQDMQPGIGAIDDVDIAAVVDVDVVGLDRDLAALGRAGADAALIGLVGHFRDEVADFLRMVRIAHVEGAHAGVEERDENDALVVDRRIVLARRVRAEASSARAEFAARLGTGPARNVEGLRLRGNVGDPYHLPRFLAFARQRFVHDKDEAAAVSDLVLREFGYFHAEHREARMPADRRRHLEAPDLGEHEIRVGRLLGPVEELLPIDDLHHARFVDAICEVDAIALRPRGNHAVHLAGRHARRAGLLAREAEVADESRIHRVREVIDLRHAARAPSVDSGDQVSDAGT